MQPRRARGTDAGPPDAVEPVAAPSGSWAVRHRYLLLAGVVTILTAVQALNGQWSSDMWEHVAVVRELIARPGDPVHPQVLSEATHPGFSPYTVLLALVARLLDVGPIAVLAAAGVANVALLLVALRWLVLELTANRRAHFWALLFVLALWGFGPYRYSGFYSLNSIGFVAPYPSTAATAAAFGALVAGLRYARGGRATWLVGMSAGAAFVVLVHPLSAPWLAAALLAVAAALVRGRRLVWFLGAGGLALALCGLWPYYPIVDLVRDSGSVQGLNRSMYANPLVRTFPAALGLVVIVRRWRADRLDRLGLFLAGSLGLYLVGQVTGNTSFGRSLAFVVMVLHIALADGVGRIEAGPPLRTRGPRVEAGALGLTVLLVLGLVTTSGGIVRMVPPALLPTSVRSSEQLVRPDERYGFLTGVVGPTDVVIGATTDDNRKIPAFAGRTLALGAPRPFVTDAAERTEAQRAYLDPATPVARRAEIEERFEVRFVLLHPRDARDAELLDLLTREGGLVVHEDRELVLVEVR